jgi:tetratricopeptide (TPR) repeat protein
MITWIGEDYINTPLEEKYYNPTLIYFSALLFSFFLLAGCAAGNINKARNKFYAGRTQKAAEILSEKEPSKRDRLLFLMEKGMVFHHLGQYESSIKEFLKASNLVEQQETISLTRQTTSLITTEWITEYKGEYSERLWIHTYLMMNYLILNKYEDALVEAKQALEILQKHSESLSGSYFTRALIALCYDNLMEFNDAYIEYKKLSELLPDLSQVATDLYRLSTALGFAEEAEYYKKFLPTKKFLSYLLHRI